MEIGEEYEGFWGFAVFKKRVKREQAAVKLKWNVFLLIISSKILGWQAYCYNEISFNLPNHKTLL